MRLFVIIFTTMAFLISMSSGCRAQPQQLMSIDLAEKSIDITTGFDGAQITLYGVIKESGDIAVTVQGPSKSVVVRRKERIFGIWMNRQSVEFRHVPTYYDFALSRAVQDIASYDVIRRNDIGLDALHFDTNENIDQTVIDTSREALVRNLQKDELFPLDPKPVLFLDDRFFRVVFPLPSNMPTGVYRVSAFLIRNGDIIDKHVTEIRAAQTGFSASISLFAHNQSMAYGVASVLMALFFGWGSYVVFRRE